MWAPIQIFFLLFSCFWWEANLQIPILNAGNDLPQCPTLQIPALSWFLQTSDCSRRNSTGKPISGKCCPFVKNCIPRSTSLIPLSSNALNTFYKTRAKLPNQTIFSGFSRLEELWSNMTFSESRPRWVWFSFWFNCVDAEMPMRSFYKVEFPIFHGGSIYYCLGLQNSEHTVKSNEEGVWQVLRKWGQRDFVPLRSS